MKQSRLVQQSLRSMRRYPLRTILMMLGSVVGVAALTFVLSVGRGAQEIMLRTVRQILGDQAILIQAGGGTMMGGPRGGSARLTLDDMDAVAREVPEIGAWDPQVQTFSASVKRGAASATVRVLGESERWSQVWQRGVSRGQISTRRPSPGWGASRSSVRPPRVRSSPAKIRSAAKSRSAACPSA